MSVRATPVAGTPRPPGGPTRFEQVLAVGQAYPRTVLEPWARVYEEQAAKREAAREAERRKDQAERQTVQDARRAFVQQNEQRILLQDDIDALEELRKNRQEARDQFPVGSDDYQEENQALEGILSNIARKEAELAAL